MSSTGPTPQPTPEALSRYADLVRQRQQELLKTLMQAQQAARMVQIKTPSPGMTIEAFRKINDRLATTTDTLQRTFQDLDVYLGEGDVKLALERQTTGLSSVISDVERAQEELRNQRQQAQTAFMQLDQKSDALFNLLTQLVKTTTELQGAVVKNLL